MELLDLPPELTRIIWKMTEPDTIDFTVPKSGLFVLGVPSEVRLQVWQLIGLADQDQSDTPAIEYHPYTEYELALKFLAASPGGLSYSDRTIVDFQASPILHVCRRFYEEAHSMHRQKINLIITSPVLIPALESLSVKRRNFITTISIDSRPKTDRMFPNLDIVDFIRQLACLNERQLVGYISRRLERVYDQVRNVRAVVQTGEGHAPVMYGRSLHLWASADVSNIEQENQLVKKWKDAEDIEKDKDQKVKEKGCLKKV